MMPLGKSISSLVAMLAAVTTVTAGLPGYRCVCPGESVKAPASLVSTQCCCGKSCCQSLADPSPCCAAADAIEPAVGATSPLPVRPPMIIAPTNGDKLQLTAHAAPCKQKIVAATFETLAVDASAGRMAPNSTSLGWGIVGDHPAREVAPARAQVHTSSAAPTTDVNILLCHFTI